MRPDLDQYFMDIAIKVSTRATCDRKSVGAVLVRDKTILSTGYNGSIRGSDHCDTNDHIIRDAHCVRVNHAELNAVVQAARNGVRVEGATCYTSVYPCWGCFKALVNAGVVRIVYDEVYKKDPLVEDHAEKLGIKLDMVHTGSL